MHLGKHCNLHAWVTLARLWGARLQAMGCATSESSFSSTAVCLPCAVRFLVNMAEEGCGLGRFGSPSNMSAVEAEMDSLDDALTVSPAACHRASDAAARCCVVSTDTASNVPTASPLSFHSVDDTLFGGEFGDVLRMSRTLPQRAAATSPPEGNACGAVNGVPKSATDFALERDLLELLSSPVGLQTPGSGTVQFAEDEFALHLFSPNPLAPGDPSAALAPRASPGLEDTPPPLAPLQHSTPAGAELLHSAPLLARDRSARSSTPQELLSTPPFPATKLGGHAGSSSWQVPDRSAGLPPHSPLVSDRAMTPAFSPSVPNTHFGLHALDGTGTFDKDLRERSLAIFSATDEQMRRPMKKSRTYSKAVPSRFCHICTRQSKKSSPHAFCLNINRGTCRKAVCEKCFVKFGWDWGAVAAPGSQWLCPHCCNICPRGAQCYNYVREPRATFRGAANLIL
jgi:hypothetical protein